jgi:hypothetical protein
VVAGGAYDRYGKESKEVTICEPSSSAPYGRVGQRSTLACTCKTADLPGVDAPIVRWLRPTRLLEPAYEGAGMPASGRELVSRPVPR